MYTYAFENSIKDNKTDIYGVRNGKNGVKICRFTNAFGVFYFYFF